MTISEANTISNPPPIAQPFTAAIMGFTKSQRVVLPPNPPFELCRFCLLSDGGGRLAAAVAVKAFPAEKARSPAPVTITTQTSGSSAISS